MLCLNVRFTRAYKTEVIKKHVRLAKNWFHNDEVMIFNLRSYGVVIFIFLFYRLYIYFQGRYGYLTIKINIAVQLF